MSATFEIFSRNIGTVSADQQQQLFAGRVAVIGCGGLGGHVIEQLVRAGVGHIDCFDPDEFSLSNCNRQLNAEQATLGRNKAQVAAERAERIHEHTEVIAWPVDFRHAEQAQAFAVDVVVDCLDDIGVRRELSGLCKARKLPLVHGAVKGWCGQVGVQLPDGDLIEWLYPQRINAAVQPVPSVIACTVGLVASLQVAEVVKLLLGLPSELQQGWLYIDLLTPEFFVHA